MKDILIDPEAEAELNSAAEWYEQRKDGLGVEFLDEIGEATTAIRRHPKAFPLFRDTAIRKFVVRRFPYIIFFEDMESYIWVYAFAHEKRKPGYWMKRIEESDDQGP